MHLSTIIIGDEVKSRPRFTNCQTFNIRLPDIKCLFNSPEVRFADITTLFPEPRFWRVTGT
jgi:hypothetical protein